MTLKLGSLFDGSGGFPLAGSLCGIEPIWASEVEPYPIAVTSSRFPLMEHLGSVTDINGAEVEPVDVLTFGSPCQDLSVAGKRAGLKHEDNGDDETTRSGLFMEAIRIIKEMREATNGNYPKWAVWENVPGAFSSNKGEDFRTVLEELIKTVEPNAVMPPVPKNGWAYADCYYGDGWSIAYRVLDAQYIRTAQRRRRIYLVLDLTGQRAGSVLFERESLRGNTPQSGTPRKRTAGDAENCTGTTNREGERNCLTPWDYQTKRVYSTDGIFPTLSAGETSGQNQQAVCVVDCTRATNREGEVIAFAQNKRDEVRDLGDVAGALAAEPGMKQQTFLAVPYTLKIRSGCEGGGKGALIQTDKSATLSTLNDQYLFQPITYDARGNGDGEAVLEPIPIHDQATRFSGKHGDKTDGKGNGLGVGEVGDPMNTLTSGDRHAVCYAMQAFGDYKDCGVAGGLKARDYKDATDLVVDETPIVLDRAFYNQGTNAQYDPQLYTDGTVPTLVARGPGAVCTRYIVRRLTPTECARLQGFPDEWGHPSLMDSITDGDYRFWLNVRKTHAAINGKAVKDYTEEQIMNWYNKLHTDSAEYRLWGNGVALPCVLFVMEGIAEESNKEGY